MCRLSVLLLAAATCVSAAVPGQDAPSDAPPSFDCAVRQFAHSHARKSGFGPAGADLAVVRDALRLEALCGTESEVGGYVAPPAEKLTAAAPLADGPRLFYVDAAACHDGDDQLVGKVATPFRTVAAALRHVAALNGSANSTVLLRGGATHHVGGGGLLLTPAHTGLTLAAAAGETPVISGGVPLTGLKWTRAAAGPSAGGVAVWSADLSHLAPRLGRGVPGLRYTRKAACFVHAWCSCSDLLLILSTYV